MPVWAAILIGVLPSVATIYTVIRTSKASLVRMEMNIKNLSDEMDDLKRKVESHNNYGLEIVALKTEIKLLKELGHSGTA